MARSTRRALPADCAGSLRGVATPHQGNLDLEPLTPIDLDDAEVGIRPEDRYAAIPPGPKLIRRRVHDESSWAPLWLLAGVVVLFAVAALLGRVGNDDREAADPSEAPPVPVVTGEKLLVIGGSGVARLDVDSGRTRVLSGDRFTGPVIMAAATADGAVLFDGSRAHALARDLPAVDLGSAIGVAGDGDHAWLLVPTGDGRLMAREATIGGAPAPEIVLPRGALRVIATRDGFVTSGRSDTGRSWIAYTSLRSPERVTRLRRDHLLLAASGTTVASTPAACSDPQCDLVFDDLETGETTVLQGALDQGPPTRAVLAPSTEWIFLQYGAELRGVNTETGRRFPAGQLPSEFPALAG
jgi:hypothetical protein